MRANVRECVCVYARARVVCVYICVCMCGGGDRDIYSHTHILTCRPCMTTQFCVAKAYTVDSNKIYTLLFWYCALRAQVRCKRLTNTLLHYITNGGFLPGGVEREPRFTALAVSSCCSRLLTDPATCSSAGLSPSGSPRIFH